MELVRVLALSFADDGKRVKVVIFIHSQHNIDALFILEVLFVTTSGSHIYIFRFVFKDLWVRVHWQECHYSWQALEKFQSSWTGVIMKPKGLSSTQVPQVLISTIQKRELHCVYKCKKVYYDKEDILQVAERSMNRMTCLFQWLHRMLLEIASLM